MLATLGTVAAAGFEPIFACPASGPLADTIRHRGLNISRWETHDSAGTRLPLPHLRENLADVIRTVRPDVLHANSLSTSRIAGPVAAAAAIRSIGHLRDILKLNRQAIDDLNQHQRLLAVSNATREFHVGQGPDAAKCFVLHNGVDLDEFQPRQPSGYLHQELNLPPNARLIAVIGQLGLRKGTDIVLQAASQTAENRPDIHWLIVGERTSNKQESREFEASLQGLASRPPLAGRVHFLGTRSDVPSLLNECTLLVHTARQEPLGRVLLESAACGLAMIATNTGGTPEIFPTESSAAILVPPDNPSAIAVAILELLNDDNRRRQIATAARRRAETAFDIRAAAKNLLAHYQQM
jgi:glycosyltransferase involved in cell wall biosynthesis